MTAWPFAKAPEEPKNLIVRLMSAAKLRKEASPESEVLEDLNQGDLVEAIRGNLEPAGGWLLVRSPLEDNIDVMTDKPLEYQDGWLAVGPPALEVDASAEEAGGEQRRLLQTTELQLGEKIAARIFVETHPVLDLLKKLPVFKDGLPPWMAVSVAEIYAGRLSGVAKRGRYVVQRPPGAMPERVASVPEKLVSPKARAKQTIKAGLLGLVLALVLAFLLHTRKWAQGEPMDWGRFAFEPLLSWCSLSIFLLTPIVILPCYIFANSQAATLCVLAWINLLLYGDLFSE